MNVGHRLAAKARSRVAAAANLILEILRAHALVGPARVAVEHSGGLQVDTAETARERLYAKIIALSPVPAED